jgi:hypothetical protein
MPGIPIHHTATSDGPFTGPADEKRLPNKASALRGYNAWFAGGDADPTAKSSYKFGHHDVDSDGKVGAANLRGCSIGIAELHGARTGKRPNIPDADRRAVYDHLAAHLRDAKHTPPPFQEADGGATDPELVEFQEAVSDTPWSKFSAASYTPEQWRRACLVDTGDGPEDSKDRYKLPVREPTGALNRNGVHSAAAHLAGARTGGMGLAPEKKRGAAQKLAGLYRNQLHEDPPDSVTSAAGQTESAPPAGAGLMELAEASAGAPTPSGTGATGRRRYRALLIEGNVWGQGSGVYYPEQVLERDGPKVWPVGTQMFLDHPTLSEAEDRPERSVRDLAGKIATQPVYDRTAQVPGLYADVDVFPHYAPVIESMADDIGLSIRAGGRVEQGQAAGRIGPIVTSLDEGRSVDFVTKAGAGGKLVSLLESARNLALTQPLQEAAGIATWLESRLHATLTDYADGMYGNGQVTRAERIALSSAIGDALDAYTAAIKEQAPQLYTRDQYGDPACTAIDPDGDGDEDVPGGNDPDGDTTEMAGQRAAMGAGPVYAMEAAQPGGEAFIPRATDPHPVRITVDGRSVAQAIQEGHRGGQVTWSTVSPPAVPGAPPPSQTPQTVTAGSPPPAHQPPMEGSMSTQTAGPGGGGQAGTATTEPTATTTAAAGPAATTVTEAAKPATQPAAGGVSALPAEVQHALQESAKQLTAVTDRLAAVEAARAAELAEAQQLRAENDIRRLATRALAESDLPVPMHARVIDKVTDAVPLTEARVLDVDKAKARITEVIEAERLYAAELMEAAGVGVPRGLTTPILTEQRQPTDPQAELAEAFAGLPGMTSDMAAIAAKGR